MLLIRLLTLLAALPLRFWVMTQRFTGKITRQTASNRLGRATDTKPDAPLIWIHAASLGELSAVRPFLRHLGNHHSNHQLLITANNPSALDVAAGWRDVSAILQVAPLDLPSVLTRFLDHWLPVAFVNIETEVWPNRFAALAKRNIPAIGLNARLSDTSAKRLTKLGSGAGLQSFRAIYAQNPASAANFQNLLGPKVVVKTIPNFKSMVILPQPDPRLVGKFDRTKTLLAASTHPGEDAIILSAFAELAKQTPNLTLILAPRHPQRAPEIAKIATQIGLSPRSFDDLETGNLYIVETLGQLPQLYGLAAVTLVGGSLIVGIGGHTPYEPIRAGSAIVTGPHTENFLAEYTALKNADACLVTKPETLITALQKGLSEAATLSQNASAALPVVDDPENLLSEIVKSLELAR